MVGGYAPAIRDSSVQVHSAFFGSRMPSLPSVIQDAVSKDCRKKWLDVIMVNTPLKLDMEPKNHPIEKEDSKPPFLCSMSIFQGVWCKEWSCYYVSVTLWLSNTNNLLSRPRSRNILLNFLSVSKNKQALLSRVGECFRVPADRCTVITFLQTD